MGIEPTLPAWKAGTLPLSYTRGFSHRAASSNPVQPNRTRHGWSRIRTCEGIATRFTVWPLWPLGYPPEIPSFPVQPGEAHNTKSCITISGRAGGETRTHNPRFTKPMLYQLSYASSSHREIANYNPRSRRHARAFPVQPGNRPRQP
jgi:hypothetical protein